MSLLLALLFAPAWAADLPQDPIERRMVVGEDESAYTTEMQTAQDLMARMSGLRRRYDQDGRLDRYAEAREPLTEEMEASWKRLVDYRQDIKRNQTTQQIINAVSMASSIKNKRAKQDSGAAGSRTVELARVLALERQMGEIERRILLQIGEERAFFKAESEAALRGKRLTLLTAGAFLALAAGGALLVLRLQKRR